MDATSTAEIVAAVEDLTALVAVLGLLGLVSAGLLVGLKVTR